MSCERRVNGLTRTASVLLIAGFAGGCSADVTRFNLPAFGLTDEPSFTNSASGPVPTEPVSGYAPNEETPVYRRSREAQGWSGAFSRDEQPVDAGRVRNDARKINDRRRSDTSADYRPQDVRAVRVQPTGSNGWVDRSATGTRYGSGPVSVEPITDTAGRSADRARERVREGYDTSRFETTGLRPASQPTSAVAGSSTVRVQRGDTLYGIARRTGASVSDIKRANNMAGNTIRVGQVLRIPGGNGFGTRTAAVRPRVERQVPSYTQSEPPLASVQRAVEQGSTDDGVSVVAGAATYRVRSGDSLYKIARSQGTTVSALTDLNNITDPSRLRVGQVLRLPSGDGMPFTAQNRRAPRVSGPVLSGRALARPQITADETQPRTIQRTAPRATRTAALPPQDNTVATDVRPTADPASSAAFRWPIKGRIIARFGRGRDGKFNDGIDIAAPRGASVRAARDGTVAYAGEELEGYGKLILVRHADDWVSAYAHNSEMLVTRGQTVARGQVIAKAGNSGGVAQPMVHFELRKGSKPVDPMKYLGD